MEDHDHTTAIRAFDDDGPKTQERKAVLLVMSGATTGQMIYLETKTNWTVGRHADNDIVFQDGSVSRNHCKFTFEAPKSWYVEDLQSSNGTFVDGNRVSRQLLQSGDKIQFGSNIIVKYVLQDEIEAQFQKELYESATKDSLTGLFSKRFFMEQFESEFNFHERKESPFSVVLGDIDYFKKINDTYGHLAGDYVLKELGRILLGTMRRGDCIGRYGGEEVVAFLRETSLVGAKAYAERLRLKIEKHSFVFEGRPIPVTISIGVATSFKDNFKNTQDMLKVADQCLYQAKQAGRNRVGAPPES